MRYLKQRDDKRKKSTHFLIQDQLETISRRRIVDLHMLYEVSETELTVAKHQYRTSGATYEG